MFRMCRKIQKKNNIQCLPFKISELVSTSGITGKVTILKVLWMRFKY